HVVVPHRVVQAERAVALAPGVAGALVLLHHQRRHLQALQPRGERNAALAAADDENVGLARDAQAAVVGRGRELHAIRAGFLLVAFQFLQRGEERPAVLALVPEAHVADAAPERRFESEPLAGLRGEVARLNFGKPRGYHRLDLRAALAGLDVPGEGDQVAPEAVGLEQA